MRSPIYIFNCFGMLCQYGLPLGTLKCADDFSAMYSGIAVINFVQYGTLIPRTNKPPLISATLVESQEWRTGNVSSAWRKGP